MPYRDKDVARSKGREYSRNYRLRQSPEQREQMRLQQRDHARKVLSQKTSEQKEDFYKHRYVVARVSGNTWSSEQAIDAYRSLRERVIEVLGGRCSSANCTWRNDDGTYGCDVKACLQVDHVRGGGRRDKKGATLYRKVLRDTSGYQLLCSNCNWIKRVNNCEVKPSRFRQAA